MLATSGIVKLLAAAVPPANCRACDRPRSRVVKRQGDVPGRRRGRAYRSLFAHAAVVTPNLPEAALLTGRELGDLAAMETAARELHALGPQLVIVKGGRRRDARPSMSPTTGAV